MGTYLGLDLDSLVGFIVSRDSPEDQWPMIQGTNVEDVLKASGCDRVVFCGSLHTFPEAVGIARNLGILVLRSITTGIACILYHERNLKPETTYISVGNEIYLWDEGFISPVTDPVDPNKVGYSIGSSSKNAIQLPDIQHCAARGAARQALILTGICNDLMGPIDLIPDQI